jgi:hypothetical protein
MWWLGDCTWMINLVDGYSLNDLDIHSLIPEALISTTDVIFVSCNNDAFAVFLQSGTCGSDFDNNHSIIKSLITYNSNMVKGLIQVPRSTTQRDLGILLISLSNSLLVILLWSRWVHVKRFQYNRLFILQICALNTLILRVILVDQIRDFPATIIVNQVMKGMSICIFSRFLRFIYFVVFLNKAGLTIHFIACLWRGASSSSYMNIRLRLQFRLFRNKHFIAFFGSLVSSQWYVNCPTLSRLFMPINSEC